ncbi:hypothetical protein E8E13_001312 [Curvularia kusanoi]|uniref:Uncharacterized protein n=1 Tax=Curvularia kusanoi TaxID=90978 RepID=A0A9P4WB49_CURKU|nr:hypothetical protein E8E13_001312 [Curvularia kusanoi]
MSALHGIIQTLFETDHSLKDRAVKIAELLHGNSNSNNIPHTTMKMAEQMVAKDSSVRERAQLILSLQGGESLNQEAHGTAPTTTNQTRPQNDDASTHRRLNAESTKIDNGDPCPTPLIRYQQIIRKKKTRSMSSRSASPLTALPNPPPRVQKSNRTRPTSKTSSAVVVRSNRKST